MRCTNEEIIRLGILWTTEKEDGYGITRQLRMEADGTTDNPLWHRLDLPKSDSLTWANLMACRSKYKAVTIRRVKKFLETEIAIARVKESAL